LPDKELRTKMKNLKQALTPIVMLALCGASGVALAHAGADGAHHEGFAAGLLHPFTGLDHLAAMLAVGVWSAGSARRRWLAPLVFMLMLLAGALLGAALPAIETVIAVSLLAAGALLLSPRPVPLLLGAAAMGGFAFFHGAAHGQELAGASALAGMVLGTAALHGLGIALGVALPWLPRLAGAAVALFGIGLLA
jgi:urease accessory protein